jgi:1-acyl-sn-glycerol-3-phosphate acyltransferase
MQTGIMAPGNEVHPLVRWLARLVLRLWGWRVEQWVIPADVKKVVVIGEHHTANTDGFLMVLACAAMGRKLSWLVKSELDKPIIGAMIRASGGIFIDRSAPRGTVGQIIDHIDRSDRMFLVLAPSGTRSKTDGWRSGFYYMALGAEVPIALGYLDYKRKAGGIGKVMLPSGDVPADEALFQAFYQGITPRHPERASTIRLKVRKRLPEPPENEHEIPEPNEKEDETS